MQEQASIVVDMHGNNLRALSEGHEGQYQTGFNKKWEILSFVEFAGSDFHKFLGQFCRGMYHNKFLIVIDAEPDGVLVCGYSYDDRRGGMARIKARVS